MNKHATPTLPIPATKSRLFRKARAAAMVLATTYYLTGRQAAAKRMELEALKLQKFANQAKATEMEALLSS